LGIKETPSSNERRRFFMMKRAFPSSKERLFLIAGNYHLSFKVRLYKEQALVYSSTED